MVTPTRSRLELSLPAMLTPAAATMARVTDVTTKRATTAHAASTSSAPLWRYWRYVKIVAMIEPVGSEFVMAMLARVTPVIQPRGTWTLPAAMSCCWTSEKATIEPISDATAATEPFPPDVRQIGRRPRKLRRVAAQHPPPERDRSKHECDPGVRPYLPPAHRPLAPGVGQAAPRLGSRARRLHQDLHVALRSP